VCLRVRRAQIIGHTAKRAFAVGQIQNTRPKQSTRRKEASPCALTLAHGKPISLPCATDRHTTKIASHGPTFTAGQCRHILPCASVSHTVNRALCRVPHGGTRQTYRHVARRSRPVDAVIFCRVPPLGTRRIDLFAVCHMEAHGKHESLPCVTTLAHGKINKMLRTY